MYAHYGSVGAIPT